MYFFDRIIAVPVEYRDSRRRSRRECHASPVAKMRGTNFIDPISFERSNKFLKTGEFLRSECMQLLGDFSWLLTRKDFA